MQFTIEKLIYGGDGMTRLPADGQGRGKAVFVPFVLEGERIEGEITEERPGFARARQLKLLDASPKRIAPACPYFAACGGCHYQHTGYQDQLQIKSAILAETVRRIAKLELPEAIDVHPSRPWNYRNRTRLKVRGGANFAIGYHRFASHELLAVEQCPISSPLNNRAISAAWEVGRARNLSKAILEIEFFANADDTEMLVEIMVGEHWWRDREHPNVLDTIAALRHGLPEVLGVTVFRSTARGDRIREEPPEELEDLLGEDRMLYRTASCQYAISAGSFFQTNRFLVDELVDLVTMEKEGGCALDLYAGCGLFTLPLSQNFRQVTAVEAAPASYEDLVYNSPSNVTCVQETTKTVLEGGMHDTPLELVVVDPPRAGMGENVARLLAEKGPHRITYVSCDPATLARDLRVLVGTGYRVEAAHLVDMFPHTFHIESVWELVR